MTMDVYRFEFEPSVPANEAEMTLHLALYAVEGLYGQARVRLDASYHLDAPRNAIVVDGTGDVGAAVVRVFASLLLREHGEDAFHVRRVEARPTPVATEKAA